MRILYILKHDPWGIGGGCYACRNYLQAFTTLFADAQFDACICKEYLDHAKVEEYPNVRFIPVEQRSRISKYLTPVTGLLHRHYKTTKALMEKNTYDYCIFDENGIAGSLVDIARNQKIKTIVINHNCQYEYSRDNITSSFKKFMILPVVERCEKKSYKSCDYNIFLTEEDKEQFAKRYGHSNTKSVVGGCFYSKDFQDANVQTKPLGKERMKMVISGTIGNVQNMDGINFFLDELLPLVPTDVGVIIAGKNPPLSLVERIKPMAPHVILIPNPEDIDSIVRDCDIFLCPTRLGGGMKLRVMDGLRNGLPVLAHRISARGYRPFMRGGVMEEFTDKEQFSQCLDKIIVSIKTGRITRDKVIDVANQTFSFDMALQKLDELING